jgi:hypothetical protein
MRVNQRAVLRHHKVNLRPSRRSTVTLKVPGICVGDRFARFFGDIPKTALGLPIQLPTQKQVLPDGDGSKKNRKDERGNND